MNIKNKNTQELEQLAQEIRDRIVEVVSINGGHFSSTLGAVELTLGMQYSDVIKITEHLTNILSKTEDLTPIFKLGNTEFGFIPNLEKITLGEYIDLDSYLGQWDKMNLAMSVLYRPVTKRKDDRYLIEDYDGTRYSDIMKQAPLNVCLGAMVFFYNLTNELLNCIPKYLETQLKDQQMTEAASVKNGEAIANCTVYLKETLQSLKKLQNYHYTSA